MDGLDLNVGPNSLGDYSWILDSPGSDRLMMEQFDNDDNQSQISSSLRNSTSSPFQPPEVIDYESLLVDKPDEEMICTLCYTLMTDPVVLSPCGHTFCNECLANRTVCPFLGCPSPTITSRTPNRLFKRSIDKLNMKCRFACGKVFPLESREKHEKECLSAPVECPNGCQKAGLYRFNLKDHFDVCPRKKNICECGKAVSAEDMMYHLKNQCDAPKQCNFCQQRFEEKDQQTHNDFCTKRKVMIIKQLFPQIENDMELVEDVISSVKGNMDQILAQVMTLYHPIESILEVFNLTPNVQEHHLQDVFQQFCPGFQYEFNFSFSDGTWAWIHLPSDDAARQMLSMLHMGGFPYIRTPISDGVLWLGSTYHMTFCPPMSTFDCPIHPYMMPSCPFKHNVYKNGQCIRWKAGQLCGKPTTCKFAHPGKTVLDLKFMSRTPNICKFCQKSSHFGWECPDRVSFGTSKDIINHVEGVAKTLEQILQNEGGQMLANRAGIALRRANPATAAVLSEQFGGKLKKLLEAYSHKFTITNQEQPGFAIIQLNNGNYVRFPGVVNPSSNSGSFQESSFMMSPSTSRPFRKVPLLDREWSREEELLPFIYNVMLPHFDKIRANPKTDRRLIPNLQDMVSLCQDFDTDTVPVNQLKLGMRVLAETLATIQLAEVDSNFDSQLDFKGKIRHLQLHNINFARALNLVRKYSNPPEMISSPSNDPASMGFQNLNEADALAECFNRLTEALGIFFRYSNENSQRRDRSDGFNLNSSGDSSQGNFQSDNLGPMSTLFGGMSIFGNSSTSLQDDSSHVPLFQRSNLNTSFSGRSTPDFNLNSTSPGPASPMNYASIFSPMSSSPTSLYAPYPHIPTYSHGNSHGNQSPVYSDAASLFSGSPVHENPMNFQQSGMYNSGFPSLNEGMSPMGNPNLHHNPNPNYHSGYQPQNTTNSYGRTVTTEKVCLNCGAVNSHTSSQCRGCSWCGRTNHVPEQCTSKLPRCGYCSKQHNKGLGHKTRDCRYLQSGKGV